MKAQRIAVSNYHNRISPVFDLSENIIIFDINDGSIVNQKKIILENSGSLCRYSKLLVYEIDAVICNAISRVHREYLFSKNIKVINEIFGEIDEVMRAFCENRLSDFCFARPSYGTKKGRCRKKNRRIT